MSENNVDKKDQFYVDLEFVQNLCSARYLQHLALQGYLDDPQFLEYLRYLTYWKEPQYAKFLIFPQCLEFLDVLINSDPFRREIALPQFVEFVHQQQGLEWMHGYQWSNNPNDIQTSPIMESS
ncbi:hypothetical protein EON65_22710 [archaeon]|nr:MAG: hypothetical protein EON65_22710 [archaeon]